MEEALAVGPDQDDEEDGDDEPEPKRQRSSILSVEMARPCHRVSWADLTEEENPELQVIGPTGSDADGLACADDGSLGNSNCEDATRQPHPETSNHKTKGLFYLGLQLLKSNRKCF